MLRSSLCLVEKHLSPALVLSSAFGERPSYVIFVDSFTEELVAKLMSEFPCISHERMRLINLDEDPTDRERMKPLEPLGLNNVNHASVRRSLADTVHLPVETGRLLLGTDVSFVGVPTEFVERAARLDDGQALYMTDDMTWGPHLYRMSNVSGPQCAGLLGDFIYLGRGVRVSPESLGSKMKWYADQPIYANRTEPPCFPCPSFDPSGLHAIDQFAWVLALGEATGGKGCFPLTSARHGFYTRQAATRAATARHWHWSVEIVHDKLFQQCGWSPPGISQYRNVGRRASPSSSAVGLPDTIALVLLLSIVLVLSGPICIPAGILAIGCALRCMHRVLSRVGCCTWLCRQLESSAVRFGLVHAELSADTMLRRSVLSMRGCMCCRSAKSDDARQRRAKRRLPQQHRPAMAQGRSRCGDTHGDSAESLAGRGPCFLEDGAAANLAAIRRDAV